MKLNWGLFRKDRPVLSSKLVFKNELLDYQDRKKNLEAESVIMI